MSSIIRKRKKLLIIGVILLLPVFSFWLMFHSGKKTGKNENQKDNNAFNDKLPAANIKDSGRNKLEIYMKAQRDSARLKELEMTDPYSKVINARDDEKSIIVNDTLLSNYRQRTITGDANEQKVNDRIDRLLTALNAGSTNYTNANLPARKIMNVENDVQIERLEKLLSAIQNGDTATGSPEMKQLETMLDRILDIQHPELVKLRINNLSNVKDTSVRQVERQPKEESVFFIDKSKTENVFWRLANQIENDKSNVSTVLATVHENQEIFINEGEQAIKLRLLENIFIENVLIPAGGLIYGKCRIRDGRAMISIQEMGYDNRIFPVRMTVYDQSDGMQGINIIGGSDEQSVFPNSADRILQQLQLNTVNPSRGAQAATTGIETFKNLISARVKRRSVKIKSGHVVILKPFQF